LRPPANCLVIFAEPPVFTNSAAACKPDDVIASGCLARSTVPLDGDGILRAVQAHAPYRIALYHDDRRRCRRGGGLPNLGRPI